MFYILRCFNSVFVVPVHALALIHLIVVLMISACSGGDTSADTDTLPEDETGSDEDTIESDGTDPASMTEFHILSAYYGLDALPAGATLLCGTPVTGEDGMPVVFSVRLDESTVSPESFAVETASGDLVTPICATLNPAVEPLERRTVLLAGPFGTPAAPPMSVRVVGALADVDGNVLTGMQTDDIVELSAGPQLVLAERFEVDTPGLAGECPVGTTQVVQLTWEGGVSGPDGAMLGEPQRTGTSITLENDESVTPLAIADDDNDNHVLACIDAPYPANSVTVAAGLFYDPGNDSNPETSIEVVPGVY